MKRLLFVYMALIISVVVFSQQNTPQRPQRQGPTPKERQEKMLNELKERLQLTAEQADMISAIMERRREDAKKEFEEIREERQEKMEAIREQRKLKAEEMRKKQETYNSEVKAVLSEAQSEKYDQLLNEKREEIRPDRRMPRRLRPQRKRNQ